MKNNKHYFTQKMVSETTRKGSAGPAVCKMVGDVAVGDNPVHSDHEIVQSFHYLKKERDQQKCYLGLLEGRLQPVWDTGRHSPLEGSPEEAKGSRKAGHSSRRTS